MEQPIPPFSEKAFNTRVEYIPGVVEQTEFKSVITTPQKIPKASNIDLNIADNQEAINKKQEGQPIQTIEEMYPLAEKLLISGQDRRKLVKREKLSSLPYSAIVRLELEFSKFYIGTGVLVGPYHALTAAHNVYDSNKNLWAEKIVATPGQHENEREFGQAIVCHVYKFDDCDLALLILDNDIGNLTGWFGMCSVTDITKLKNQELRVTGYPFKGGRHDRMFTHKGKIPENDNNSLCYDIDTSQGQSGSPVWIKGFNKNCYIIGIHTNSANNANKGVILSRNHLEIIIKWIENKFNVRKNVTTGNESALRDQEEFCNDWKKDFGISMQEEELSIEARNLKKVNDKLLTDLFGDIKERLSDQTDTIWNRLTINLEGCAQIGNDGLRNLIGQISDTFTRLEKLALILKGCNKITDQGIKALAYEIGTNMKGLNSLILDFSDIDQVTDKAIKELASQIGSNLRNLQHLEIKLYFCNVTDKSIEELGRQIGAGFAKLKTLNISFYENEITDAGIKQICNRILSKVKNIEHLSLNLGGSYQITDAGITQLANAIGLCTDIKYLDLYLSSLDQITNQALSQIIVQVKTNLKELQHLYLDFRECLQITDQGLNQLVIDFPAQNKLEEFGFYLEKCQITNDGIKSLIKGILPKIPNLTKFELCLNNCEHITDDSIEEISLYIGSHLKKLKELYLNFGNNEQISNRSVTTIASQIGAHLKRLESLIIYFPNCKSITKTGILELGSQIKHVITLKNTYLDFSGCKKIKKSDLNYIREDLKSIENLNIV